MSSNLPFDPRGYINFLLSNHLKGSTPTGKIGAGTGTSGFANARPINVKSIASKAGGATDDILSALFKKGSAGLGGLAEEVGTGARLVAPMVNPALLKGLGIVGLGITGGQLVGQGVGKAYDMYNKATAPAYKPSALRTTPPAKASPKPIAKPITNKQQAEPQSSNTGGMGNNISYQQLLKNAGIPILDNFSGSPAQNAEYAQGNTITGNGGGQQYSPQQQVAQSLAEKLGLGGYVQPDEAMTTPLATERLNQIREYLNKYTPESYRQVVDTDARNTMMNQSFANTFRNPALANIPTEQERQAKVLEYLQNGYNADMGLANTARKLAEADAMTKATGLPSSMFEDPKDVLANIIRPQITAQGQIDLSKQQGANAYSVANLNNVLKKYGIDATATTEKAKMKNAQAIAKIIASGKIPPAMLGAMSFGVQPSAMMPVVNMNGGNYVMPDVGVTKEDAF